MTRPDSSRISVRLIVMLYVPLHVFVETLALLAHVTTSVLVPAPCAREHT